MRTGKWTDFTEQEAIEVANVIAKALAQTVTTALLRLAHGFATGCMDRQNMGVLKGIEQLDIAVPAFVTQPANGNAKRYQFPPGFRESRKSKGLTDPFVVMRSWDRTRLLIAAIQREAPSFNMKAYRIGLNPDLEAEYIECKRAQSELRSNWKRGREATKKEAKQIARMKMQRAENQSLEVLRARDAKKNLNRDIANAVTYATTTLRRDLQQQHAEELAKRDQTLQATQATIDHLKATIERLQADLDAAKAEIATIPTQRDQARADAMKYARDLKAQLDAIPTRQERPLFVATDTPAPRRTSSALMKFKIAQSAVS